MLGLAARWVNERSPPHISGECFNPSTTGNIRAPTPLAMCRYARPGRGVSNCVLPWRTLLAAMWSPRPEPPRTIPTDVDRGALEISGRVSADEFRGAVLVCEAKARDAACFDQPADPVTARVAGRPECAEQLSLDVPGSLRWPAAFCIGGRTVGVEFLGCTILKLELPGGESGRDELWVNDGPILSVDLIESRWHLTDCTGTRLTDVRKLKASEAGATAVTKVFHAVRTESVSQPRERS